MGNFVRIANTGRQPECRGGKAPGHSLIYFEESDIARCLSEEDRRKNVDKELKTYLTRRGIYQR